MLIGAELRALQGDGGPQRAAQAAMQRRVAEWRDRASVRAVAAALAPFEAGGEPEELPALAQLMTQDGARAFADTLVTELVEVLGTAPLAHVALRHTNDARRSTLLLTRVGRVSLSLETRVAQPGGEPMATTAVLSDIDTWDMVLAGAVEGRLLEAREAGGKTRFTGTAVRLQEGDLCVRRGRSQVLSIARIERCFTVLRLQRRAHSPAPAQAIDLASGDLVRQAAGDLRDSRREMMVGLLGRMERSEDAPVLAEIAREAGCLSLRWEAVRQCLGLDTATGFRLVAELTRRHGDPIQPDAAALRAHLLALHPQLEALEGGDRCPA